MIRASRGRVVMLVDNGVVGDSRVQKQAISMSQRGWDVTLLGRSPDNRRQRWQIGGADVRLLPVERPLLVARYMLRRAPLRAPLAYPPGPVGPYRQQMVAVSKIDLQERRLRLDDAQSNRWRTPWRRAIERASIQWGEIRTAAMERWVAARVRQTESLAHRRARLTSVIDRLTFAFWKRVSGVRMWRRYEPHLWDYELAYAEAIDRRKPDLIHANDLRALGIGARAAVRLRARGRDTKLVWDAHELVAGIIADGRDPRWLPSRLAYEHEHAPFADAVVTVSQTLANRLVTDFDLDEQPAVVLNTPADHEGGPGAAPSIRESCGLGKDVPLVVYSGGMAPQRGVATMVEAMPALPGTHVALVAHDVNAAVSRRMKVRAAELGVADRLHVLPYVAYDEVVQYLSSADVGVIPIHHYPNHEVALITKFFEYSHARLPIVVSDVEEMARTVRSTGQGEVFVATDVADYVRAVKSVLAAPGRYRTVYDDPALLEEWTWERQADVLDGVYTRLVTEARGAKA